MNEFPTSSNAVPPLVDQVLENAHAWQAAAQAKAREMGQAASQAWQDSRGTWKEVGDTAAAYVKQNPGKAVLAGLGAGFLIGLLFREK